MPRKERNMKVQAMKAIKYLYDTFLRPYLPYKICVRNGVAVRNVTKLFDQTDIYPEYEEGLISELRKAVTTADSVVIVGGGEGVSSVVAAEQVGPEGEVITFEASIDQFEIASETISLNCMDQRATIKHALVGPNIQTIGDMGEPETIQPSDIPACDVLELDCEGSEIEILRNMTINPRTIVVETHGGLGSPEDAVREELSKHNYKVISKSPHGFPMTEDQSSREGVFILRAIKK